jgi:hypothetical protein
MICPMDYIKSEQAGICNGSIPSIAKFFTVTIQEESISPMTFESLHSAN